MPWYKENHKYLKKCTEVHQAQDSAQLQTVQKTLACLGSQYFGPQLIWDKVDIKASMPREFHTLKWMVIDRRMPMSWD